jgi:hypothetical protein
MQSSRNMFATMAVLALWSTLAGYTVTPQSRPPALELVQKLQSDKTTDDARRQLLQLGKSDPDVRRYLAAQLPPMIDLGPKSCPPSQIEDLFDRLHSCPWDNAVELAGSLKISETASSLARWINWRNNGPLSTSMEAQLIFYPAAKALAEIGDPSVPVVQRVLNSGSPEEHARAVRVLCIIHSPKAKAVLQEDLPHETDPVQQTMIRNSLRE